MVLKNMSLKLFVSDIDGTLVHRNDPIAKEICEGLKKKKSQGYEIVLITGRNYSFAYPLLKHLDFSYYLGLYNGSLLLSMPQEAIVHEKYLSFEEVFQLFAFVESCGFEFIIEASSKERDRVFFRKEKFSFQELDYFSMREQLANSKWEEIKKIEEISNEKILILKCFSTKDRLNWLKNKIQSQMNLQVTIVEDPFKLFHVLLVTHKEANKGFLLKEFIKGRHASEIIVCGNDLNDLSMLLMATKKVVVEGSPKELIDIADQIVSKPQEMGIKTVLE
jgi:Cof subfamily protein (haloacid dehalogenase superfamily)